MRVTTVAILGLLAFIFPGMVKTAIATDRSLPLSEQLENSGLLAPNASGSSEVPRQNFRQEMFQQPLVPTLQPPRKEKTISKGAEGAEVAAIQRRLQIHGFNPGTVDGVYGYRTVDAVNDFQKSQGLTADGVVDKETWLALKAEPAIPAESAPVATVPPSSLEVPQSQAEVSQPPVVAEEALLAKGTSGSKVKTLQVRLDRQGFDPGPIDGIFGSRTLAAVKDFQEAQGLQVNGVVNETTWKALSGK